MGVSALLLLLVYLSQRGQGVEELVMNVVLSVLFNLDQASVS